MFAAKELLCLTKKVIRCDDSVGGVLLAIHGCHVLYWDSGDAGAHITQTGAGGAGALDVASERWVDGRHLRHAGGVEEGVVVGSRQG